MRYVTVQSSNGGTMTDIRPYLEWLGAHADELPPGARAFALDPEHYDFSHTWCPRSASFDTMSVQFTDDGVEVILVLAAWGGAPPEFVLRYRGVSHVESDGDHGGYPRSGLLVDELLPHPDGVIHELEFTGGTITVVARDLTAGWRGEAGPESPRDPRDEVRPSGPPVDLHDADHAPVADVEIPSGTVVDCTVMCHHPFGMGVWVADHGQFGHVDVPAIRDGKIRGVEDFPTIGTRVRAVARGYSGSRQLRLSTRPSDLPG